MNTAELQALVGRVSGFAQREALRFSLSPTPLPKGALIEITGFGKTEFVAQFLAEHKQQSIWLEENVPFNPFALFQRKVCLKNVYFVEAEDNLFWASSQVIQSNLYNTIVINSPKWNLKQFRQIQLMAQKSQQLIFILSKTPLNAWPISLSLKVRASFFRRSYDIHVHRKRSF